MFEDVLSRGYRRDDLKPDIILRARTLHDIPGRRSFDSYHDVFFINAILIRQKSY